MEGLPIDSLCKVSRIALTEEEKARMEKELEEILEYFDSISDVDCDSYDPAYHPVEIQPKFREDEVEEYISADETISQTKTYRFFVVGPKI
jgi:aspartyl/glutamyl-tRNA(Asn/Gln) amidotransferase C subunit